MSGEFFKISKNCQMLTIISVPELDRFNAISVHEINTKPGLFYTTCGICVWTTWNSLIDISIHGPWCWIILVGGADFYCGFPGLNKRHYNNLFRERFISIYRCGANLCFNTQMFIKYFRLELFLIQSLASTSMTLFCRFIDTLHL